MLVLCAMAVCRARVCRVRYGMLDARMPLLCLPAVYTMVPGLLLLML